MKTSFWTRLFDLISPRSCPVCGKRLSVNECVLCASCHLHLPLTGFEQSPLDNPMARLFWGQFPVERAAALFFYQPQAPVSQLVYDMKYRGRPELGEHLGAITARHFAAAGFFEGIDALVPVPITRRRQWQRGYNQSLEIARGVSSFTHIPVWQHVVSRARFHESQTRKHVWERLRNVEDAFQLRTPDKIAGRHILLVDDIVTTGATIIACGSELAKAPGVKISVMALGLTKS